MLFDNQVLSGSGIENQRQPLSRVRLQEFSGAGFLFDIAPGAVTENGSPAWE